MSQNDSRGITSRLVDNGTLPSFDLPLDATTFQSLKVAKLQKNFGKYVPEHSIQKSLSSALTSWAPGSKLVIEKTNYKISGILIPRISYIPDVQERFNAYKDRFSWWLNQPGNISRIHICRICRHVLANEDSLEIKAKNEKILSGEINCETCGNKTYGDDNLPCYTTLEWIQPEGYGPQIDSQNQKPITQNSQAEYKSSKYSRKVLWPIQYTSDSNTDKITSIKHEDGAEIKLIFNGDLKGLRQIVGKGEFAKDASEDIKSQFSLCRKCGIFLTEKDIDQTTGLVKPHLRPYPFSPNLTFKKAKDEGTVDFDSADSQCKGGSGEDINLLLGRKFQSSILSLRINLGPTLKNPFVNAGSLANADIVKNLENSGFTLGRTVLSQICSHKKLKDSDFDCDVRFRNDDNKTSLEIFFFETSSGGSGNLGYIYEGIEEILVGDNLDDISKSVKKKLSGESCMVMIPQLDGGKFKHEPHPCNKACNGCLLDYRNSASEFRLDREMAYHLWLYVIEGREGIGNPKNLGLDSYYIKIRNRINKAKKYSQLNFHREIIDGNQRISVIHSKSGKSIIIEVVSSLTDPHNLEGILQRTSDDLDISIDGFIDVIKKQLTEVDDL